LGDAALFKMLQGTGAKGVAAGALHGMAGEGVGEAVEEGTQQYIGNEATNEAGGQNIDPMDGVMQAAATAGTIGALSGGAVGAIGGARGEHAPQVTTDNEAPVTDAEPGNVQPSAIPAFDVAISEVQGIERKYPGQHAIGRDGDKYRAAYVDEMGNVQVTPAYGKVEDVRTAMGFKVPAQPAESTAPGSETTRETGGPAVDEFADIPAYQRKDGGRVKGFAEDSEVQRALAGEFGPSVAELVKRQVEVGDQGPTAQEKPFVDALNAPLGLPNKDIIFAGDANAKQPGTEVAEPGAFDDKPVGPGPQFRGSERTRWQDGQEGEVLPLDAGRNPAGSLPGRVIDGEVREVGTELPYKPFIAGEDNTAAVATDQQRQSDLAAMAEQQQNQLKQIGQSDTIFSPGTAGADNKNSAYTPPRLSRDQVDNSLGEQSTRDPRSPVAQAIDQAGSEPDTIFGQLKSLRITKRGKPFASQKEAQLASRKTETPIALPTGGFGVVDKAELEQVQANQAPVNQPLDMPSATVSQEPTASVINEGTSQQPSRQEVTDGMPPQLPETAPVLPQTRPDSLPPADGVALEQNTAPAPDAGVAVSGDQSVAPTEETPQVPWTEIQDRKDGTAKLVGDKGQLMQWAKDNGVRAMASTGGVIVAKPHVAKVKQMAATPVEVQKAADNQRREQEAVGSDYPELNELVAVYGKPSPSVTETRKAAESRVKESNAIKAAKGLDESYRFDKLIDSNWQSDRDQALALAKEVYSVGAEQEQSSAAAADGKTKIVTINYGGSDTTVKLDKPVHEYTREQFSERLQEAGFGEFKVKGKVVPSSSAYFHQKREEMIIDAHKSGANIPMDVVAEYPGIFRSDLSADQRDQMMDELRDLKGSDLGAAIMSWSHGSGNEANNGAKAERSLYGDGGKTKIADFGEKIGGARKDVWTSYRDSVKGNTAEQIAELPLSKAWPGPDYQKLIDSGVDARAVGLMRAAREAIPSKPRAGYKVKSWASSVKELRDLSMQLLDGSLDTKVAGYLMSRSPFRATRNINNKAELYQAVGHQRSLADLTLEDGEYSMKDGVHYSPPKKIWSMSREGSSTAFGNWPRMFITGDTKEQVIAEFRKRYDQLTGEKAEKKAVTFDIYSDDRRASWVVGKKVGRNYIPLSKPFENVADARRYREENYDALVAELEKRKAIPNERRDINQPRVGEDMRSGADVTPEMFSNAFGFRGVEFGNWVEGSRRQRDLNDAYDALMDMAAILNIHPKAISLNGQLGLAFGARGSGGVSPAAAHYELGKVVINLTKMNGAGSLGHEWWHALDNYFGRMRGDSGSMSDARDVGLAARGSNYVHRGEVRKEMVDAFGAVKRAIDQTAIKARSSKLDGKRSKDYWTTDKEMSARAFESYLISKLQDQGVSNDYLANVVGQDAWEAMSSLGFELDESYPYPTAGEIPSIRAGFDHLFDTIEQKEDGDRIALFSLSDTAPNTRGMTKPELEMVATDWSKQYKGAASARIMVAANQAEMNEVLGMVGAAMPDGQTINAAYLPGYKTLLLNAEAIQSPKRARELMRHELLAHHGLREVVGDDAYISIIEAVKRGKDIKGIKDAYYQVAENYTDMHPDVQAEEVFAHWMEQQPDRGELAVWWRGIVRRVKDALRAVGLVGERTTEEEFNRVLDAIATGMRNGRKPGRRVMESWHDAPAYSMRRDPFKPDTFDARAFADEVDAVYRSGTSPRHQLRIGDTPSIYVRLGAKNHELVMPASVVKKATNPADRSHNVAIEDIKRLPQLLSDPLAVMKSATENNALVSLVEALDMNNKPVIVAIHMDAKGDGFSEVNKVASVYGKDEVAALQRLLDNNLVYLNKEKAAWFHAAGLQLPGANYHGGLSKSVLTKDDIRNSRALFSLGANLADQSIIGKAESLAKAAPSSVLNWIKEQRGVGLRALTDLQIDQIYRGVTGGAVSRYQKLRTKMEADRNDILLDAETRIDPLWDSLGKEQKKALSNLMHDATMAKLHPDLSLADNSLYQEAKERLDKAVKPETKARYQDELNTIADNHKHLAERYNLGLNKEGKALYQTMRETYDKQWADLRDAIEQRLEDMMGAEGKTLSAELRLQMEHALKHGPYFPLARFGDYVVKASKGDEHIREHFERRKDAEQAIEQYQRDGYNAVMTVKEEGNGGQANSNALGMKVMQLLDQAGESGASASAIKDDVWQAMLQMLPDASFAKHAIHRRRVKGASRDGHRAYLNSVYHYAQHVSKIRYGHKMQAELNKMNEQIQAGVHGEESNIKPGDLEVAQQVLNEMNKRHELNMNPKGAKWTGWAGNLGFMWYMAGSPASAIINMTQNFTVMLPQLGAKYGFGKASAAMAKAMFDYAKHGKFKAGTKEAWVSLTRADSGITHDEKALLNSLYKAGALDLTQAHSVAARADTDLQDAKPGAAWRRKTMAWLGSMFHNAEVLNREVAALAAYRLLKSADPSLSPEQYADKVTEMVYDGHGNYAASNRPRYMRGDVTKVLTQFKIYSQMMTFTLYRNAYLAAKGDKVALKTLGGVLGTHFIMAGMMGLPYPVTAAMYSIAAAADDDDDRTGEASFRLGLAETLGTGLGELVARGPMDAMTGLSIAGRTGINDLWFREPKEGAEGDDLAWHVTQQIAGPVLGIGVQAARGLSMMSDGDYQRGAEAMMPKAVKDLMKTYRQSREGERTRKGDVIIDDVSAFNLAMQAMGFSNAEMAKVYDAREYIKGKEGRIEDERSKLMSDYFIARKDGDEEALAEVMVRIREFNSSHYRTEAITSRTLRQSIKSKQRSAHRTQGGVYLSRNREYLRAEGGFIGDGGTATN
jgi:hypothetical protein